MTLREQTEFALREADRMRIEASRMKQLGFKELARFLNKNADAALNFASTENRSTTK